jgi:putative ATPase
MRSHGIGVGYKLPQDFDGGDVDQQYLPDELAERSYYDPTEEGWEARIKARMDELSEQRGQGSRKRRR